MLLQLLVGLAFIVLITVLITTTCLEFTDMPVISEDEWTTYASLGGEQYVVRTCTRPLPHVCKNNGPCNGFPRVPNQGEIQDDAIIRNIKESTPWWPQ